LAEFFPLGDQNIWKNLISSVNLTNFTLKIKKIHQSLEITKVKKEILWEQGFFFWAQIK
jgi:hypothetical protein